MTPTAADVLETAMSLSPDERVDVATQSLRSAGTVDAARLAALRDDVAARFAQIDRGEGIEIRPEEVRDYIRGLGVEAAERVADDLRWILDPRHVVFYRQVSGVVHISCFLHEARNFDEHRFP